MDPIRVIIVLSIIGIVIFIIISLFRNSSLKTQRSILKMFGLDYTKEITYKKSQIELKKHLTPILTNAFELASYNAIYIGWGDNWKIDRNHLLRFAYDYLILHKKTAVTIKYKEEDGKCITYIDHAGIHDPEYYYYALAVEIVERHLCRANYLEHDFEEPFEGKYSLRNVDLKEWKSRSKLYYKYWKNQWKFEYDGNWLNDKKFIETFVEGLINYYTDFLPSYFTPQW